MKITNKTLRTVVALVLVLIATAFNYKAQQTDLQLPTEPLKFGVFTALFEPGGTFSIQGDRWPKMTGNWKATGNEVELTVTPPPRGCEGWPASTR